MPPRPAIASGTFPRRACLAATALALAAVAGLLWVSIEDGWLRQVCFVVMSLGSLSTVLFNGNPLMKLDGYFALCDSLDLPNLSDRSSRLHLHAWQRLAHRLFGVEPPPEDGGVVAGDRIERLAGDIAAMFMPAAHGFDASQRRQRFPLRDKTLGADMKRHQRIGIGGDDIGASGNELLMHLADDIGAVHQCQRRPFRLAERGADARQFPAHATVE